MALGSDSSMFIMTKRSEYRQDTLDQQVWNENEAISEARKSGLELW